MIPTFGDIRANELTNIKCIIHNHYSEADGGIFGKRSAVDETEVLFRGGYFTLEISRKWDYFVLLGATDREFREVASYYSALTADKKATAH